MPEPKHKPRRLPVNPTGDDFAKMKHEDGPFFRVLANVGAHRPGPAEPLVVSAREFGEGADLQRLVGLGAIAPATDEEADAYIGSLPEWGDDEPRPVVLEKSPAPALAAPAPAIPAPTVAPAVPAPGPATAAPARPPVAPAK